MKRFFCSIGIALVSIAIFTQNSDDALRYSVHKVRGTARSIAMGGAFGALGSDFSSLSINPAGLATYRSSELTVTPGFYFSGSSSRYFGKNTQDFNFRLNFNNWGMVLNFTPDNSVIKAFNIGLGYNRIADFNGRRMIAGDNPGSTYSDYMAGISNLYGLWDYDGTALFYEAYLIDNPGGGDYMIDSIYFDLSDQPVTEQRTSLLERGKINDWVFSAGININDILYLGTTVDIQMLKYSSEKVMREYDALERSFRYFTFNQNIDVLGEGYTGKIGAIVRPIPMLRIGVAYHLPTIFLIDEESTLSLTDSDNNYYDPLQIGAEFNVLESEYWVKKPFQLVGSIGVTIGKFLVLSGDIEYTDYSKMRMNNSDNDFDDENNYIKDVYRENVNVKAGAEFRYGGFYARAGGGFYGSPYKSYNVGSERISASGGIGFRNDNFFMDIGFEHMFYDFKELQYEVEIDNVLYSPEANIDIKEYNLLTTFGIRF